MKTVIDLVNLIKNKFSMRKDIAPVETSSTASRAYKAGEEFYYGNLLQRATQDIPQGSGLAGGVNFENADPVTTTIQNLSTHNNVNGSKNILPHLCNGSSGGITYTHNQNGELIISGTSISNPAQCSLLSTGRENIGNVLKTLTELGIDKTKTYVLKSYNPYSTDSIRIQIHLRTSDGTVIQSYECGANVSEHIIDMSQFPTCEYIDYGIAVGNGFTVPSGTVLKSMFCLKSDYDLDPTYVSPALTNRTLTADKVGMDLLSEVGAVNYLENIATSQPIRGIDFTVNADKTVVANGTLESGQTNASLALASGQVLKAGTYLLRGCPKGGGVDTYRLQLQRKSDYNTIAIDNGDGVIFNLDTDTAIYLAYRIGGNVSNVKCYPMICPVEYTGPFVPYAKTNRELTEDVTSIQGTLDERLNGARSWNTTDTITWSIPTLNRVRVFYGGRNNKGFMIILFPNTNEYQLFDPNNVIKTIEWNNNSSQQLKLSFNSTYGSTLGYLVI